MKKIKENIPKIFLPILACIILISTIYFGYLFISKYENGSGIGGIIVASVIGILVVALLNYELNLKNERIFRTIVSSVIISIFINSVISFTSRANIIIYSMYHPVANFIGIVIYSYLIIASINWLLDGGFYGKKDVEHY